LYFLQTVGIPERMRSTAPRGYKIYLDKS
jgi:hypothetical protein